MGSAHITKKRDMQITSEDIVAKKATDRRVWISTVRTATKSFANYAWSKMAI